MINRDYRNALATHFLSLTRVSRSDIFGDDDSDLRPINWPDDNSTMFAGFVGNEYEPKHGLLLLAINPGGGGDAYTERIPEDEEFYPLLHTFKEGDGADAVSAFEAVNSAFVPIVKGWNLWRILEPTLDAAGASINDVAYMNVVPYRTRHDKMPPVSARRISWSRVVEPTLALLEPKALICLGKKAGSVIDALMKDELPTYCVPRTIGDSYISDDAKVVHERMRTELQSTESQSTDSPHESDIPVLPKVATISAPRASENFSMATIHMVQQLEEPFRPGSARSRAWLLLQAFDGLSVESFVEACRIMEEASGMGGDPAGWVKFFTATGRYENRPGNTNASEKLAEVRE